MDYHSFFRYVKAYLTTMCFKTALEYLGHSNFLIWTAKFNSKCPTPCKGEIFCPSAPIAIWRWKRQGF